MGRYWKFEEREHQLKTTVLEHEYSHVLHKARVLANARQKELIRQGMESIENEHEKSKRERRFMNSSEPPMWSIKSTYQYTPAPTPTPVHSVSIRNPPSKMVTADYLPSFTMLQTTTTPQLATVPEDMKLPDMLPCLLPNPASARVPDPMFHKAHHGYEDGRPSAPARMQHQPPKALHVFQDIKDEVMLDYGRPSSPSIHPPLSPTSIQRRPDSVSTSPAHARFSWRPRSGFPGALAAAPAGLQAMVKNVQGSFRLQDIIPRPETPSYCDVRSSAPLPATQPIVVPDTTFVHSLSLPEEGLIAEASEQGVIELATAEVNDTDDIQAVQPEMVNAETTGAQTVNVIASRKRATSKKQKHVVAALTWVGARGRPKF